MGLHFQRVLFGSGCRIPVDIHLANRGCHGIGPGRTVLPPTASNEQNIGQASVDGLPSVRDGRTVQQFHQEAAAGIQLIQVPLGMRTAAPQADVDRLLVLGRQVLARSRGSAGVQDAARRFNHVVAVHLGGSHVVDPPELCQGQCTVFT